MAINWLKWLVQALKAQTQRNILIWGYKLPTLGLRMAKEWKDLFQGVSWSLAVLQLFLLENSTPFLHGSPPAWGEDSALQCCPYIQSTPVFVEVCGFMGCTAEKTWVTFSFPFLLPIAVVAIHEKGFMIGHKSLDSWAVSLSKPWGSSGRLSSSHFFGKPFSMLIVVFISYNPDLKPTAGCKTGDSE